MMDRTGNPGTRLETAVSDVQVYLYSHCPGALVRKNCLLERRQGLFLFKYKFSWSNISMTDETSLT